MTTVRDARLEDAPALGRIHVRAWQAAYRGGLMPDDHLDGLSVEARVEMWTQALGRAPMRGASRLVAEDEDGRLLGFAASGPEDGDVDAERGQLYALNVDPDAWSRGAGTALLLDTHHRLAGHGFTEAILWVHPGNDRARRFYERHGWVDDAARRTEDVLGVTVAEIRYRRSLEELDGR